MNKNYYKNNQLYSLDEILSTGTLFKNIYKPYKKVPTIVVENKEENLLLKIQAYEIALMDLNLHLDNFPNDSSMTMLYKQYNNELEKLTKEFEDKYYPLSKSSSVDDNQWKWIKGMWPWESVKNV